MRSRHACDSFHGSRPPMKTAGVSVHGMSKSSAPFWRTRHSRKPPAAKRSRCRQISSVRLMLPGTSGHVANRHRSACSALRSCNRRNFSASNFTNAELSSANTPPQLRLVRDGTISCPATSHGISLVKRSTSGGFVSRRNLTTCSRASGFDTRPSGFCFWRNTPRATQGERPTALACSRTSLGRMACGAA